MKQPEALRLADALDAEFVQGRISNHNGRKAAVELRRLALKQWVSLTDEEIDALSQARSLTDELMDCVDRLGSEADTVDPRVWQHLLVYAPKPEEEPVAWITNGGKGELWWHRSSKFDEEGNLIGPNQDDIPLYTAPPKKQWVGLTLNEAEDFYEKYTDRAELINAIDRFLEEKNA
jgi:hypothetical protein